jgi:hypothetical protein
LLELEAAILADKPRRGSHPVTVHATLSPASYFTLDSPYSFPKEYSAFDFGIKAAVEAPQTANLDRGASYVDTQSGLQGRVAGAAPGPIEIARIAKIAMIG